MLKPLFKYAGGKYDEYKMFSEYIPSKIENYIEPFAGSCGVYFRLKNENRINGVSYINDISCDLINFFNEVGKNTIGNELQKLNKTWKTLKTVSSVICYEFGKDFINCVLQHNGKIKFDLIHNRINELLNDSKIFNEFNFGGHDICSFISKSLFDKIKRFTKKEITANTDTICEICISTGIYQGFYFCIRQMYNEWLNNMDCIKYTQSEKACHWFFIREMCYGSMYRFNSNGDFNIPYGGFTYNKKNFDDKINNITKQETINSLSEKIHLSSMDFEGMFNMQLNEDDFIFLDPPYDTIFNKYENNSFGREEHERLSNSLKNVKCKWLMVIKNTEFIFNLYKDWCNIHSFDKTYTYQARGHEYDKNVTHLIITNY